MSRIGKLPIKVPTNVNILLENENIYVKGPTGELAQKIPKELSIVFDQDKLKIVKLEETRLARQKYGLVRSLIMNMVLGVNKKFEKNYKWLVLAIKL